MPIGITPMLATLVDQPINNKEWVYEVKWDGYRTLGFINKGDVQLLSRNNKVFNDKYYPITKLLANWKINAVIDGELVVLNEKGISDFSSLQNWRSEVDGELALCVFDLLWYNGKNLMNLPFVDRHVILNEVLPQSDSRIRISVIFDANGAEFLDAAEKLGLEGIMAKRTSSIYTPNVRSKDWLKIKINKRQEVVIGGFTKNKDTDKQFSSLLLGVYNGDEFQYVGKVGTGFSDKIQKEMMEQFKPLIIKKSPFEFEPDVNQPSRFRPNPIFATAIWLKPELVCEVAYTEVTKEGVFRHPSFKGMRVDKNAKEVIREKIIYLSEIKGETKKKEEYLSHRGNSAGGIEQIQNKELVMDESSKHAINKDSEMKDEKETKDVKLEKDKHAVDLKKKFIKAPIPTSIKTLLNPSEETQVKEICGHEVKFTSLSKVYWPEDKITKRDMFNYYYQIADYILPYLKDRPQSLNRFPNGIHGDSFYQKDVKGKAPDWIKTFPYTTNEGEKKEYVVGVDEATLLWMASLGCIEMNPWFSRVQTPDNPDYCIIDLDPDENSFDQVVEAAQTVKQVLNEIDVSCFCKTSGSTGMHIYIPLQGKISYDQSQLFAKLIVQVVHERLSEFTSLERMVKKRKGKMYLDFLQNRPGATIACPYSLRPKIKATVSMPLAWEEVKPGLKMQDFTIKNAVERVKTEGDLFKGVLGKGIDLEKVLLKANSAFGVY